MPRMEVMLDAVGGLYDAVLEARDWSDRLSDILKPLNASRSFFVRGDLVSGAAAVAADRATDAAHVVRFQAAAAAGLSPAWRLRLPQGRVVRSSDMQSDAAFARSAFYNEVVRPTGDFHGLVVQIARDSRRDFFMCLHRARGAPDFTASDIETMERLTPHIAAAIRLEEQLAALVLQAASTQAALDGLEEGVLLLDARAEVVFANAAGERMLSSERELARAVTGLTAPGRRELKEGGAFEVPRTAHSPLRLRVSPVDRDGKASWRPASAVAAVFVSDPDVAARRRREALAQAYDLTPAEARFAAEITRGDGRAATARRLGISPATAQTHLSRIFEKTGTNRQAELVRLLFEAAPR